MSTIIAITSALGLLLSGIGAVNAWAKNKHSDFVINTFLTLLCLAMFGCVSRIIENESFAKQVDMTMVPVKGTRQFVATVKFKYTNGKLGTVTLVEDSTKAIPEVPSK